jgi:hypothetical protein
MSTTWLEASAGLANMTGLEQLADSTDGREIPVKPREQRLRSHEGVDKWQTAN